jgi:hypothetical protein
VNLLSKLVGTVLIVPSSEGISVRHGNIKLEISAGSLMVIFARGFNKIVGKKKWPIVGNVRSLNLIFRFFKSTFKSY